MTEDEVVQTLYKHYESLFPKVCPNCNRSFAKLREYIENTRPIGPPVSYDAELENWKPKKPIGSMVFANCPCGSTLALDTEGMPLPLRLELLDWIRNETKCRGMRLPELLDYMRDEVHKRVLCEAIP